MTAITELETIPDPARTMEGLRDTGYTFETAVADLVDNSIAADATKIDVRVQLDLYGQVRLSITDDGVGMHREDLVHAMTYGSPVRRDPASLGKFGLGLKTASTAFCRRLSVVSRPSGDTAAVMATWDLDHVIRTGKWLLQISDEPDAEAVAHLDEIAAEGRGTVVLWDKVDRLLPDYKSTGASHHKKNALSKKCSMLLDHLAMTYQRFLDRKDRRARNVQLTVNGNVVEPWDPFQTGVSELVAQETRLVDLGEGGDDGEAEFTVRAFILPRREEFPAAEMAKAAKLSSNKQGLYIYREQRLLHAAGWLKMFKNEPHGTLLRVEFSFNHRLDRAFHLDIKKSQILLNDTLWNWAPWSVWLRDQFLTAPRREANRRYREGKRVLRKDVKDRSRDAHDASNKSIGAKEAEIGGPEVDIQDLASGKVTVSNAYGDHSLKLKISSASKPGEVFVVPADDVTDGMLFEPALVEMHKAVRINTQHPYYHKMYVPNFDRSVTVQGMDALLWALCVAELRTTAVRTEEAFKDMRYEVSRILRKLVEGLPEPDLSEDADAA